MNTVFIFDIQRNSFVDGPGIRTTVFFKGCDLKCAWCHNPESQSAKPQMMFYRDKCTGCGKCVVILTLGKLGKIAGLAVQRKLSMEFFRAVGEYLIASLIDHAGSNAG